METNSKLIEKEEQLNNTLHDLYDHERVLFNRTTVFTGDIKVLNIHHGLYDKCPDFKELYEYLSDVTRTAEPTESAAPILRSRRSYGENTGTEGTADTAGTQPTGTKF